MMMIEDDDDDLNDNDIPTNGLVKRGGGPDNGTHNE